MISIVQRPLSEPEAQQVHIFIKQLPQIIGYMPKEITELRDVWVAEVDGQFAGLVANKHISDSWVEIGLLVVFPQFRQQGIGRMLFMKAYQSAVQKDKKILAITKNPHVKQWLTELHFQCYESVWKLPLFILAYKLRFLLTPFRLRELLRKTYKWGMGGFVYATN